MELTFGKFGRKYQNRRGEKRQALQRCGEAVRGIWMGRREDSLKSDSSICWKPDFESDTKRFVTAIQNTSEKAYMWLWLKRNDDHWNEVSKSN